MPSRPSTPTYPLTDTLDEFYLSPRPVLFGPGYPPFGCSEPNLTPPLPVYDDPGLVDIYHPYHSMGAFSFATSEPTPSNQPATSGDNDESPPSFQLLPITSAPVSMQVVLSMLT